MDDRQRGEGTEAAVEAFIAMWSASGGAENANAQGFIRDLCDLLRVPRPDATRENEALNSYVFEKRVDHRVRGLSVANRIDCYKQGCFILEAKQSSTQSRRGVADPDQGELMPSQAAAVRGGTAKRGTAAWDKAMRSAYNQAVSYVGDLPAGHRPPPFVILVDVGHVIELYANFSGQGRNYTQFPDRQSFQIRMEDLRDPAVRARLAAVWTDPHALDPAKKSAEVTRDIAERLARIARSLEKRHDPKDVAEFLMRCLFTMFAEDVGLLPQDSFRDLLEKMKETPANFVPALESLWTVMDTGGYAPHLNATLKRFNGALFKTRTALPLEAEAIHEMWVAARRTWEDVEPAIFGTLLERALDRRERSKLGAHYTPRAYVERLVVPTIIEPLREDWRTVQAAAEVDRAAGRSDAALQRIRAFHHTLCTLRILDPACGTGNFLYVSLELMKRLEGEVLDALEGFGEEQARLAMEGETVSPRQFYGLELNPRAVPIADLVLWIGYLKWQIRTGGAASITEPVLHAYGTIRQQDAILAYDARELARDESGAPVTVWDGLTKKVSPVTGLDIPDESARRETFVYRNPRAAEWPQADFIVGNPPFIGGKDMRAELGDGYAEAAWKARPHMPGGADFVMHFWDQAAQYLREGWKPSGKGKPHFPRRFGFITTNSITQTFSRRIIERHLSAKAPLSLVYAVPDHPWLKASDKAAVRIAMTVGKRGDQEGVLAEVVREEGLNTDAPLVTLTERKGKVLTDLHLGVDLSKLRLLNSNEAIGLKGFELGTQALLISADRCNALIKSNHLILKYIFPYLNGNDLKNGRMNRYVIDTYPSGWEELNTSPELQNYLLTEVRHSRNPNTDAHVLERWWQFRRTGAAIREAVSELERFIATTRTAKHRYFTFLSSEARAESKIVIIAADAAAILTLLSARQHIAFANRLGGRQGVGNDPVYQHTDTFDPFPFPAFSDLPPALVAKLSELGERLDAFRKARLAEHDDLTMTGLYNVLERVRELEGGAPVEPLTDKERSIYERGLVGILKEIHDEIDRLTFTAYGWDDLAPRLVGKPGATTPSPHKSEDQEAAEEELLTRLVALNQERAAEEARGLVRWLRPDYQIPKLGHKVARPEAATQLEVEIPLAASGEALPKLPDDVFDRIKVVRALLARAPSPILPKDVAAAFAGRQTAKKLEGVAAVLANLAELGLARTGEGPDGATRYFAPRG
ncbi:class I SAM-dependent DNA methyltransferase [Mangrovibrevibacter kandeliae]|uniref:class I SAM-dependent DNA methyltransferase n=1 Tax=Mangrovibrevibacter kandeliae TaxID=2968473 RepID=UPI00211770A0|nr:DNA methyltransferase [Aurantimonas sp. CSK15Z-1]MCQ8783112.1 class I SAM-dependent DNA methyltransferase [Aurantimonas sp. CSK15Z-1]